MERAAKLTFPLMSLEETGARLGLSQASQKRILEIIQARPSRISSNGHSTAHRAAAMKRTAATRGAKRRK